MRSLKVSKWAGNSINKKKRKINIQTKFVLFVIFVLVVSAVVVELVMVVFVVVISAVIFYMVIIIIIIIRREFSLLQPGIAQSE